MTTGTSHAQDLARSLQAIAILRAEPTRAEELSRRIGVTRRTALRMLAALREVGELCRRKGLPSWEITSEMRGTKRYYRLFDRTSR